MQQMPENSEYRKKIDDFDRQITGLLKERMETAAAIAGYKKEHGIPVFDAARERSKLNEIAAGTDPELRGYMALLYSMIFEVSRSYQTQIIGARSGLAESTDFMSGSSPTSTSDRSGSRSSASSAPPAVA